MFERIKAQVMTRNYNKQNEEIKWTGPVCPKIKKKVEKNVELANHSYIDGAGDGLFAVSEMVSSTPIDYIVDLKAKTCTCNRWQKSGIPCPHVLSCIRKERIDPLSLVDHCYSVEMHNRAYENIVYPCKDKSERRQAEKEKRDLEKARQAAAKRAQLQQEARDRAQLMATLRAAKASEEQEEDDASDFVPPRPNKVNMFDEFRNPR
jgi:hypothetical protein